MAEQMTGLFGPSPYEIQQARSQALSNDAADFAKMNATQRGVMGLYQGGAGLARMGAGMMGMVDPAVEQAQQLAGAAQGIDTSTPEGLIAFAQKVQGYAPGKAAEAIALARKMKMENAAAALAERKQVLQEDELLTLKKQQEANKQEIAIEKLKAAKEKADRDAKNEALSLAEQKRASMASEEIRKMLAQAQIDYKKSMLDFKSSAQEVQKPKNLSREAGLAWELENGRIDQATYDAAMSATPAGKLRQQQQESLAAAEAGFNAIEQNILKVYDPATKSLRPAAQDLFGKFAQYRPEALSSQETVNAKLALESLTDQVMMANLADAKKRVGQSFGSMQVQEWDKFTNQLTSLKRGLSEEAAAKAMRDVLNFVDTKRSVLNKALETTNTVQPKNVSPAAKGASPSAPDDFNARWATLKSGQSLVGPDGKTYTKK